MMSKLVEKVKALVKDEYELASAIYGAKHNSPHEAAAVILEELEEASLEESKVGCLFGTLWDEIKKNTKNEELNGILENMRESAILCACEMIQVAAMAHKAMKGYVIDEPNVLYDPVYNINGDSPEVDIADVLKEREGVEE